MRFNLRLVVASAVGIFALLVLLERFVLVELLVRRTGLPLILALVTALAAIGCGAAARRSRVIDAPLDLILGVPIFGTLCFLVGLASISTWTMVALVAIVAIATVVAGVRHRQLERGRPRPLRPAADDDAFTATGAGRPVAAGGDARSPRFEAEWRGGLRPSERFALLTVALVLACGFVMAQAPPISLDELAYHLAVPQTWVQEGRAVELPLSSHSYFPMGVESASLPALTLLGAVRGGIASHLLHLLVAVAVVLVLIRRTRSWLTTAAIVTTPALAVTAGWTLVEWPLVGLAVILVAAVESDDDRTTAAATAAGLLTKYTFLPLAVVVVAIARKWRPAVIGAVAGSVFFLRNLLLTGNPVAPFLGADAPHVSGYRALQPMDFIFQGRFVDEAIGGSILAAAAGASGAVAAALLVVAVALFVLGPSARILLPYLAVPAAACGPLVERSRLLRAVLSVLIVVQLLFIAWYTAESAAFGLLAGRYSEEEYVRSQRPSMAATEWLNSTLPAGSRTLVVGLGESYWFTHRVRSGGNFDGQRVSRYLTLPNVDALRARLRKDGITHIAVLAPTVTTAEASKRSERTLALTEDAQRSLAQMLNRHAANATNRGGDALFELKP